jgi:hypothetical protein
MRRVFTSKQQRKQAEDAIISNMRNILERRENEKTNTADPIDKEHVMSILTKFVKLKKLSKFH